MRISRPNAAESSPCACWNSARRSGVRFSGLTVICVARGAGGYDAFQRFALVRGVSLDRIDEIGIRSLRRWYCDSTLAQARGDFLVVVYHAVVLYGDPSGQQIRMAPITKSVMVDFFISLRSLR